MVPIISSLENEIKRMKEIGCKKREEMYQELETHLLGKNWTISRIDTCNSVFNKGWETVVVTVKYLKGQKKKDPVKLVTYLDYRYSFKDEIEIDNV